MWNDDEHVSEEQRTVPLFGPAAGTPEPAADPRRPAAGASEYDRTRPAIPRDPHPTGASGGETAVRRADAATDLGTPPDSAPTTVAVGSILMGKYQVERKLGEGGMGSVWLVRHIRLDEPRALKVIGEGIAGDARVRARFELEARILAKLKHPCAVAVHDTGIVGDTAYIEMEFIQGDSLRRMLRRGEPSRLPFILWVMRGMCDVLSFAHNRGIVHRDLKPENVMIVVDPETGRQGVKVVDFGIAKIVQPADSAQSVTMNTQGMLGTPAYSSPEQNAFDMVERTRSPIDHRSDIYSLGVMLYEFLTGELPFKGNWTQVLYQHASVEPRPLREVAPGAGIPPAVEVLVLRCLAKSPEGRPASAAELYNSLREAAGEAGAFDETVEGSNPTPAKAPLQILTPHPHGTGQPAPTVGGGLDHGPRSLRRLVAIPLVLAATASLGILALPWIRGGNEAKVVPKGGPPEVEADSGKVPPPPGVSPEVVEYLRSYHPRRPYEAEPGAALVELDGKWWPSAVAAVRGKERRRLELRGRAYVPPGAVPDESVGDDSGRYKLPLVLKVGSGKEPITYRLVAEGTFWMGEKDQKRQETDDKPYHKVAMSPYYLQETETTIAQFEPFRRSAGRELGEDLREYDEDASARTREGTVNLPAIWLPRSACEAFAASLGARLPTEAQWEYAARSRGERDPYVWSDKDAPPSEMANIDDARLDPRIMDVKSFNTDRTMEGIFDMAGNVREWCRDVHRPYLDSKVAVVDPVEEPRDGEPDPGYSIRGGSFMSPRETARVSFRSDLPGLEYKAKAREKFEDVGFRTVVEIVVARKLDEGKNGDEATGEGSR